MYINIFADWQLISAYSCIPVSIQQTRRDMLLCGPLNKIVKDLFIKFNRNQVQEYNKNKLQKILTKDNILNIKKFRIIYSTSGKFAERAKWLKCLPEG